MKILMIYCNNFAYNPSMKTLENVEEHSEPKEFKDVLVGFIQGEAEDEDKEPAKLEKTLVKNLKWGAGKNSTKNIILHSFAHLSESKASPEFTKKIFDLAQTRLQNAEYITAQTPFGYFLDLKVDAPGVSQARMFKSI